ncbi:MAG TPA: hypothetical protein VFW39_06855 [Sphingomicrobium sp.]|nr:hypothetical protein [Sphingomicrobium sp.]
MSDPLEVQLPIQRFAVEFDHHTVGIAVRVPGGFIFYSSNDRFDPLDGHLFPRVRTLERELKKQARRNPRPRGPSPQPTF